MDVPYNNSLDDAMKNYVSTLETRWINKLKESNEELSDYNRIMSSRIDTLAKEHFGLSQYLGETILIYCLHFY
jgi:hypothetical protein